MSTTIADGAAATYSSIDDLVSYEEWVSISSQIAEHRANQQACWDNNGMEAARAYSDEHSDFISHRNHHCRGWYVINMAGERVLVCDGWKLENSPRPFVGMPATILLYTDTSAAVVTKVNGKSIEVASVATGEPVVVNMYGPFPRTRAEGLTNQVIGEAQRYTLNKRGEFRRGSIGLQLGESYRYVDYSF